jgi:hypothetical protein
VLADWPHFLGMLWQSMASIFVDRAASQNLSLIAIDLETEQVQAVA